MSWPDSTLLLAPLAPWFNAHRRAMPWRAENLDAPHPDPYAVLVSEAMLQQTQVATVIPYFERWMARFPTPATLATAPSDAVHKAWEGLGYYRRARLLQSAAQAISEKGWPGDLTGLLDLPGLGPYTAAAVASIAFQWPAAALDGNAFRVLARLLRLEGDPKHHAKALRPWLEPAQAAHGPSRITQAVMELGATVCTPQPRCGSCPLLHGCAARAAGVEGEIPAPLKRAVPKESELWLLAIEHGGEVILHPPGGRGLLAGLWRWPTRPRVPEAAEAPVPSGLEARAFPGWTQVYTHRRERVNPLHLRPARRPRPQADEVWVPLANLAALPMGKRDSRLREALGQPGEAPLTLPTDLL
jgi:A/G-specific adenine glycosylase